MNDIDLLLNLTNLTKRNIRLEIIDGIEYVNVNQTVNLSYCNISKLPVRLGHINGDLDISHNQFENLNNMPLSYDRLYANYNPISDTSALKELIYGRVSLQNTPYRKLQNQNKNRDYVVPDKVIKKMIGKLEIPTYKEACDVKFVY